MKNNIFLHGIKLKNFRGFGPDEQTLAPFKTFNFFIGANNSGKSTVLAAIERYLPLPPLTQQQASNSREDVPPLDIHAKAVHGMQISMGIPVQDFAKRVLAAIPQERRAQYESSIGRVGDALAEDGLIWCFGTPPYKQPAVLPTLQAQQVRKAISPQDWDNLWQGLKPGWSGNGTWQDRCSECLQLMRDRIELWLPSVCLIPAIRKIGPRGESFDNSGRGLIDRLAEIQNPDHDRLDDREIFAQINRFVVEVTGISSARIDIPHDRKHILVHTDTITLPLESLGTGIHEVIILAALCTLNSGYIVCMEEPELHLHPVLQKKLVRYLQSNTTNQYFVSTHSASFIDTPNAAVFHVSHDGNRSTVKRSLLNRDKFEICQELGYKASDLLQANAVIWVEGPSDRVYLEHWISSVAPELIEGIHYSIMFYGGRLLNHLSAKDDEITEFISLRTLNRHIALVMDSDKPDASAGINDTKKRLLAEFSENGGIAWITAGKEIENYIDPDSLQDAVKAEYSASYVRPSKTGEFDHALYFYRARKDADGKTELFKDVDKIKVARKVCDDGQFMNRLDLKARIDELVGMIRGANA